MMRLIQAALAVVTSVLLAMTLPTAAMAAPTASATWEWRCDDRAAVFSLRMQQGSPGVNYQVKVVVDGHEYGPVALSVGGSQTLDVTRNGMYTIVTEGSDGSSYRSGSFSVQCKVLVGQDNKPDSQPSADAAATPQAEPTPSTYVQELGAQETAHASVYAQWRNHYSPYRSHLLTVSLLGVLVLALGSLGVIIRNQQVKLVRTYGRQVGLGLLIGVMCAAVLIAVTIAALPSTP